MDEYPLEDLAAYQVATDLKDRITSLILTTPAGRDLAFRTQILEASDSMASNIAEGHGRYNPAEFANFLRYSRASVNELIDRLPNGVRRGYYRDEEIRDIMPLLRREAAIVTGLRRSMINLAKRRKEQKRRPPRKPPDP